jgi:hypothetical protein
MEILYNRSNQVLTQDGNATRLYSYNSLVLEIVNGEITIDARAKTRKNYDGIQSVTTSKHITQALSFLNM